MAYHVDEGLAKWLQIGVLAIGSIVMIVVLATKWPAIKAYIRHKPQPEFSSVPSLPSGSVLRAIHYPDVYCSLCDCSDLSRWLISKDKVLSIMIKGITLDPSFFYSRGSRNAKFEHENNTT